MSNDVSCILHELFEIDPSLRSHEAALIPLIEKLQQSRPSVHPDVEFVRTLRQMLQEKSSQRDQARGRGISLSMLATLFAGLAAGVIIAVPSTSLYMRSHELPSSVPAPLGSPTGVKGVANGAQRNLERAPAESFSVSATAENAFGPLTDGTQPDSAPVVAGRGGGAQQDAGVMKVFSPSQVAPGYATEYHYVYKGTLPSLPKKTVDVLEREKGMDGPALTSLLSGFDVGSINLLSFEGSTLNTLTFSQNTEFGYTISVTMDEGEVGISQNWQMWPHPETACSDEACVNAQRMKMSEVLTDAEATTIASAFASSHGIDLSHYGPPQVDASWRAQLDAVPSAGAELPYIPEISRVVYPLLIDGKQVYDQAGGLSGISMDVHNRLKRVVSVWGLQTQRYRSSAYAAVTDPVEVTRFLDSIERMPEGQQKQITVELGEPTEGYVTSMRTTDNGSNQVLVVPCLVFPFTEKDQGLSLPRANIIVPLAKELLESALSYGGGNGPVLLR